MLNKDPLFPKEEIDWKLLLMRILNCFGDMENDWHEEYWRKFGVTRDHVLEADIIFGDGKSVSLKRGSTIKKPLRLSGGQEIRFPDIKYTSPACKNAAGYYIKPGMDWLDLFIGSDGTLCIFTRIRLKLLPCPAAFVSGVIFFTNEEMCWSLVDSVKKSNKYSVIITSSNAANSCVLSNVYVYDESYWKNITAKGLTEYTKNITIA